MAIPRLMAFFATELTQVPNLTFPKLHVTQAIKPPQKWSLEGLDVKAPTCWGGGGVRCRGKVVTSCYARD